MYDTLGSGHATVQLPVDAPYPGSTKWRLRRIRVVVLHVWPRSSSARLFLDLIYIHSVSIYER